MRVVLDDRLRTPSDSQLSRTAHEAPVVMFTSSGADSAAKLKQLGVDIVSSERGARDLSAVLAELGRREIQSVLVEGGGTVAGALFDAGLVNKVTFFIAPMIIGGQDARTAIAGAGAEKIVDAFQLERVHAEQRGRDFEITGYPSQNRLR